VSTILRRRWAPLLVRPWLAALLSYLLVGTALLAPALRPGHTVVPADIANQFPPFNAVVPPTAIQNPLPSDAALQFYPWLRFLGESVRQGHLPQWNPYVLGGVQFTPNGYVTSYYPPYLLAALVAPLVAYTLYVLLHLVIAAMGTYAFARTLRLPARTAWLAGLGAFGALHWAHWSLHLTHISGMVWLPGVLAACEWAVTRPGRRSTAVLALVFGLWWLGGGLQYTYFGSLALAGYGCAALLRTRRRGRRALVSAGAALAGGVALGFALAAPVLLPTASLGRNIVRVREPLESMTATHFSAIDLLLLVVPDARGNATFGVSYRPYPYGFGLDTPFVGVTALLLACAGLAVLRRGQLALAVGLGATLLLAFAGWPHIPLHALVPGYDRFRVSSRWLAVLPAFALALSAVGAAAVLAGRRRARIGLYAAALATSAAVLVYGAYVAFDAAAPHRFFAAALGASILPVLATVAAAALAPRQPRGALVILAAAILFEATVHVGTWFPDVRTAVAYPPLPLAQQLHARGGRLIRLGPELTQLGPFPPDLPLAYGLLDAQGQAVLYPARYDRYLRLLNDYGTYALATNTAPPLPSASLLSSPLVRALDVRTAIADPTFPVPPRYRIVARGGLNAYAVHSLGPATVVPRAHPAAEEAMWRAVASPRWRPDRQAMVVGLPRPVNGGTGRATLRARAAGYESWLVDAPAGGLLRVSGNYAPGWSARVDGRSAPVYLADGIFRAVVVPPGRHRVSFAYRNGAEIAGRRLGAAALLVVALLLLPRPRRRLPRLALPSSRS